MEELLGMLFFGALCLIGGFGAFAVYEKVTRFFFNADLDENTFLGWVWYILGYCVFFFGFLALPKLVIGF